MTTKYIKKCAQDEPHVSETVVFVFLVLRYFIKRLGNPGFKVNSRLCSFPPIDFDFC